MAGLLFQKSIKRRWVFIAFAVLLPTALLGFQVGPRAMVLSSMAGLVVSLGSLYCSVRWKDAYPPASLSVGALVLHVSTLIIGIVLYSLFLKPLQEKSLVMPVFKETYRDAAGLFQLTGPTGWDYEPVTSPTEVGVTLRPTDQRFYMGVSEVKVLVREMASPPASLDRFLSQLRGSLVPPQRTMTKKEFTFQTKDIQLMSGAHGILSTLEIRRFWIPFRQISLYGVKEKDFLCSVSATGLAAHSTLSEVLCLGLFEAIHIDRVHSHRTKENPA